MLACIIIRLRVLAVDISVEDVERAVQEFEEKERLRGLYRL